MKKNIIKIDSILKDLKAMHEFLGGGSLKADYTQENVELNQILTLFREEIFSIRAAQKQRDVKEQKLGKTHPDLIRLNFSIREGIKKCEDMIVVAQKRATRSKDFKYLSDEEKKNIKRRLDNCANMLLDVKQTEEGGTYRPPEAISLQVLMQGTPRHKVELVRERKDQDDSDRQSINVDEIEAFETFDKNDEQMDNRLDRIIEVNDRVIVGAKATGEALQQIDKKTRKITKTVDTTNERLAKTQDALGELIKKYRRPNKFCLDITLVVMLLGLIAVVVNMVTKKSS